MTVNEALKVLESIFSGEKAITAKSVWEKSDSGYKYVLTAHGLLAGDKPILLSKFILWTDNEKRELVSNNLTWLYDINCVYRSIKFTDEESLRTVAKDILTNFTFGNHIKSLSKQALLGAAGKMNEQFAKDNIKDWSIHSFTYLPIETVKPCEETTFDFKLSLNGERDITMTLKKQGDTFVMDVVMENKRATAEMAYIDKFIETACSAIIKLVKEQ